MSETPDTPETRQPQRGEPAPTPGETAPGVTPSAKPVRTEHEAAERLDLEENEDEPDTAEDTPEQADDE